MPFSNLSYDASVYDSIWSRREFKMPDLSRYRKGQEETSPKCKGDAKLPPFMREKKSIIKAM